MAKKKAAIQRKTRTREHIIGDLAVNHVEKQVLLRGFTLERTVHDYGVDLVIYTYNAQGEPEAGSIQVQVKATEKVSLHRSRPSISFRLERADLLTWLSEPMPVVLCLYEAATDLTYWLYVQNYFESLKGFNLFRAGKTVTVHLPVTQVFTVAAVGQLAGHLEQVRRQLRGRIQHD